MSWSAENPPSVGELFFGGGSGEDADYRYKLNGVDQYVKLTPTISPEPSGLTLTFDAIANADAVGVLSGGSQSGLLTWRVSWSGGVIELYRVAAVLIDGVTVTDGQLFELDGLTHNVEIALSGGSFRSGVTCVGASYNPDTGDASNHSNSIIYNVNVNNGIINDTVLLTDKSQGENQQSANGTINATIVNYDVSGWVTA